MKRFGEKLAKLRQGQGLTLRQLGEELEVHNTFISQIEKGRKMPNAVMILKIANLFGVTADQLMRDDLELDEWTEKKNRIGGMALIKSLKSVPSYASCYKYHACTQI